jgi:translation initiation factor 4E
LVRICSFDTVEGFARIWAYLARSSDLSKDSNIFLFRYGVTPSWEENSRGGCWLAKVRRRAKAVSRAWESLAMSAIGENFEEPDVVGVVLSIRREAVLAVWNTDCKKRATKLKIGETFKTIIDLDDLGPSIEYKDHSSSMRDGSTFHNTRHYTFTNEGAQPTPAKDKPQRRPSQDQDRRRMSRD